MTVLVRADASALLGSGHVARCANLGARLRALGRDVHFVCADIPETLRRQLLREGFPVHRISPWSDWQSDLAATRRVVEAIGPVSLIVVDHYALDARWESELRCGITQVMVVDDLADRPHDCDYLLDLAPGGDAAARYSHLVPEGTLTWFGPQYALLRPEFDAEDVCRDRDGIVRDILVYLGGGVTRADMLPLLCAIAESAPQDVRTKVLLGYAFPDPLDVARFVDGEPRIEVLEPTEQVLALVRWADLGIGACGGAGWERCAVGLPSIAVTTAANQTLNAAALRDAGAIKYLGPIEGVRMGDWESSIRELLGDPEQVRTMGIDAHDLTAGRRDRIREMVTILAAVGRD